MPLDRKEELRAKMTISRCEANIAEMTIQIMDIEEKISKFKESIEQQEQIKAECLKKLQE